MIFLFIYVIYILFAKLKNRFCLAKTWFFFINTIEPTKDLVQMFSCLTYFFLLSFFFFSFFISLIFLLVFLISSRKLSWSKWVHFSSISSFFPGQKLLSRHIFALLSSETILRKQNQVKKYRFFLRRINPSWEKFYSGENNIFGHFQAFLINCE